MSLLVDICPQPWRGIVCTNVPKKIFLLQQWHFIFGILQQTEQSNLQSAILVSKQTVPKQTYTNIQGSAAQCGLQLF